jgi:tetratricopeptide (TPR) repeat protein
MKNTMRKLSFILSIITFCNFIPPIQAEPADEFLKAYLLIQEGDAFQKGGEATKASGKYNTALKILKKIAKTNPDWNSNIISYRSKYCTDNIAKVGGTIEPDQPVPDPKSSESKTSPPSAPVSTVPKDSTVESPIVEIETSPETPSPSQPTLIETVLEETKPDSTPGIQITQPLTPEDRINHLEQELSEARNQIKDLLDAKGGGDNEQRIRELIRENQTIKATLEEAQRENEALRSSNERLQSQLDEVRGQLRTASSTAASEVAPEVLQTLQKENALLRSIVERQFEEDRKRTAVRDALAKDLEQLGAQAESIRSRIAVLQTPLTPLSEEEAALLKTPAASLRRSSEDPNKLTGVVTANRSSEGTASSLSGSQNALANEAKILFGRGDLEGSAAKYEAILESDPRNLFALSNLGVVRFRQDQLDKAEKALNAALEIDPQDAFSLSVLGIVQYRQGDYDDAIATLNRALAINDNNHETHNYLGITYSQKGYQEAAEKELLKAIELRPDYGDAHFNLAVVFASQTPPSVEMARKHYKKALSLGVTKDSELEKILNK